LTNDDWIDPLVFKPNSSDFGLASKQIRENPVANRLGLKPGQAFVLYTEPPPDGHGNTSIGVVAISTAAAHLAEVPPHADALGDDPFHACLDWRGLDGSSKAKKRDRSLARATLLDSAEDIGRWQHGPVVP